MVYASLCLIVATFELAATYKPRAAKVSNLRSWSILSTHAKPPGAAYPQESGGGGPREFPALVARRRTVPYLCRGPDGWRRLVLCVAAAARPLQSKAQLQLHGWHANHPHLRGARCRPRQCFQAGCANAAGQTVNPCHPTGTQTARVHRAAALLLAIASTSDCATCTTVV